jgi:histidinol phosphatase-like enzyme
MSLKKYKKILCFDLDGVICKTNKNYYKNSLPLKKSIKLINKLFLNGFYIKIFTARGMGRSKDCASIAKKKYYKLTIRQLKSWEVKFHKLYFGKVSYDLIVDDKALFFNKKWTMYLEKKLKIRKSL